MTTRKSREKAHLDPDRDTLQPSLPLPRDLVPLALSPDGKQLAFSVNGQRVQLRDMEAFRLELAKLGLDW